MRTLVLTAYDDAFEPLGKITSPLMAVYAKQHGFDFECMRTSFVQCHPSWWKIYRLLSALVTYDRVIWMDADIVVTNDLRIPPGESGYHCSRDWGEDATEPWMLSNCCFAAFPDSLPLIGWILDNRDNYSKEFHEQEHMRAAARDKFKDVITVHPPRVFNAVPIEIHPTPSPRLVML